MSRLLLFVSAALLWASLFIPSNPAPFGTLALAIMIAVGNVIPGSAARHHMWIMLPLLVVQFVAVCFFALLLVGNVMNSFDVRGVDLTIAVCALTASCGIVLRSLIPPKPVPQPSKLILPPSCR